MGQIIEKLVVEFVLLLSKLYTELLKTFHITQEWSHS